MTYRRFVPGLVSGIPKHPLRPAPSNPWGCPGLGTGGELRPILREGGASDFCPKISIITFLEEILQAILQPSPSLPIGLTSDDHYPTARSGIASSLPEDFIV